MSAQLAQALEKIHALAGGEPFEYRQIALEALAAFEAAPQQEPDCWAILTPNGSRLVSPDEAKGRKDAYPLYAAPQQAQAPKVAVCDFVQVDDSSKSSRSQHDADSAELRSLCAERDELRRWKSTYAPRLAALEGSLQHAQREAAQGMEARSALASEREANAILTDELEAQQAQAPIDPDGAESRAGFRAFDEAQMARWATPWQVWREAVKWAAPQQGSNT